MSTTPTPPPQTALGGPNWAAAYHHHFSLPEHQAKYPADPGKGLDEASGAYMVELRSGRAALPPGAVCIFDLEPQPYGCAQLYWPTWKFRFFDGDALLIEGVLNNENHAMDGYVGIQAPDSTNPPSVWNKSSGYRLIAGFDPAFGNGRVEIGGIIGTISVGPFTVIPWVAHP